MNTTLKHTGRDRYITRALQLRRLNYLKLFSPVEGDFKGLIEDESPRSMVSKNLDSRLLCPRMQSCRQLQPYMSGDIFMMYIAQVFSHIYHHYRVRILPATPIVVVIKRWAFSIPLRKAVAYLGR